MTAEILKLLTILLLIKVHKQQSSFLWIFSLVYDRDVWVKLAKALGSFAPQLPLFAYGVIDYYWK